MLETHQNILEINKLYKIEALSKSDIQRNLSASVWIKSGAVSVYGSDSATQPIGLADMTLDALDIGITGKVRFENLPNYIAIVSAGGAVGEIVSSGIAAVVLSDIS